jgi:threonine/homoserine/homoserine lactone efflux protein
MEGVTTVLGVAAALLLGAASPGPSFVVVARTSVAESRRSGLAAAAGMGTGAVALFALALLGLQQLLDGSAVLFGVLKLIGGCYLLWMALSLWRHSGEPMTATFRASAPGHARRAFGRATLTQLANPKTAIVYAAVLVALLPPDPGLGLVLVLLATVMTVESGWYALVAVAFSARVPRAAYARAKTAIDRWAAVALGALGAALALGLR